MSEDINVTDGTVLEVLNGKVDVDFGNVASNSVGFAKYSTEVTNCITEIPQRIKLELNNGVLTLKAGSKVIVPNGFEADGTTPKFDYRTISSDITQTIAFSGSYNDVTLCYNATNNSLGAFRRASTETGSGTGSITLGYYYNSANNKVIYYSSGTSDGNNYSLPLGLFSNSASMLTGVNNIFNGFGYIGQCTWVDKGVKALFADGRNEDGTLKNKEIVTTKIKIKDQTGLFSVLGFLHEDRSFFSYGVKNYFEQDTAPVMGNSQHAMWFNTRENLMYQTDDYGATWHLEPCILLGDLIKEYTGNFTSMSIRKPLRVLDYNELEEVELLTVTQSYKSGSSWYRVYSDGWVEQGGTVTGATTITFLIPFSHSDYCFTATQTTTGSSSSEHKNSYYFHSRSTTSIAYSNGQSEKPQVTWYACGYKA